MLQNALDNKKEYVIIFEDDIEFCEDFDFELEKCFQELPSKWDGFHLAGYSPNEMVRDYSKHLHKCLKSWGGYAYVVRYKAYQKLIDVLSLERWTLDTAYCQIMHDLNWFKAAKKLVYHKDGWSDIDEVNKTIPYLSK